MPLPLIPLITAGASLVGTGVEALATGNMNKKNQAFAEKQYETQKRDNLQQWQMQNDYNSPTSQMARFQEAGLNPALIYGQGAGGGGTASPIPTARLERPDTARVSVNPAPAVEKYFNTKMQTAQYDNFKAQNTVLQNEAMLKDAQRLGVIATTFGKDFDNKLNSKYSAQMRERVNENLLFKNNNLYYDLHRKYELEPARNLGLKLENEGKQKSNEYKDNAIKLQKLETNLREKGISPSDPIYLRIMSQAYESMGGNKIFDKLKK